MYHGPGSTLSAWRLAGMEFTFALVGGGKVATSTWVAFLTVALAVALAILGAWWMDATRAKAATERAGSSPVASAVQGAGPSPAHADAVPADDPGDDHDDDRLNDRDDQGGERDSGAAGGTTAVDMSQTQGWPDPEPLPAQGRAHTNFHNISGTVFRVNKASNGACAAAGDQAHARLGFAAFNNWGYNVHCPTCTMRVHVRWTESNRGLARPMLLGNILGALRTGGF